MEGGGEYREEESMKYEGKCQGVWGELHIRCRVG